MSLINPSSLFNTRLYKFTNKDEYHHGLPYHDGVNIDIVPFNPSGECSSGGMYFFDESQ